MPGPPAYLTAASTCRLRVAAAVTSVGTVAAGVRGWSAAGRVRVQGVLRQYGVLVFHDWMSCRVGEAAACVRAPRV